MDQVVYNGDERYPGPTAHGPPAEIKGIPSQGEIDAFPRMFTWGELKEVVRTGDLERLMRNKAMQARYDKWMNGIKARYGSTEKYLTQARLPWASPAPSSEPAGTYDISQSPTAPDHGPATSLPSDLAPSTLPSSHLSVANADAASTAATPGRSALASGTASGTSTPNSAGFVSLASLGVVNGKLRKSRVGLDRSKSTLSVSSLRNISMTDGAGGSQDAEGTTKEGSKDGSEEHSGEDGEADEGRHGDIEPAVYLRYDPSVGLDGEKYAVLPNDWPYNVPYGVRHYCVWSRVPIAHPELVQYDPAAWSKIEEEGLGGFTGVTPLRTFRVTPPPTTSATPASKPVSPGFSGGVPPTSQSPPIIDLGIDADAPDAPAPSSVSAEQPGQAADENTIPFTNDMVGRSKLIGTVKDRDWYAADVAYSGGEMRQWAGKTYECEGGLEVGKMVKGLWDERGWECLWFVNPPRLQSVPGFSHFHVFARRKTPEEIDASEAFWQDS